METDLPIIDEDMLILPVFHKDDPRLELLKMTIPQPSTRQAQLDADQPFKQAVQNAGGKNYLGDPQVVLDTIEYWLDQLIDFLQTNQDDPRADESEILKTGETFADIFLGNDKDFQVVPGWNMPGRIDVFCAEQLKLTNTEPRWRMIAVFMSLFDKVCDVLASAAQPGMLDEQWRGEILNLLDEYRKLLLGISPGIALSSIPDANPVETTLTGDKAANTPVSGVAGDPYDPPVMQKAARDLLLWQKNEEDFLSKAVIKGVKKEFASTQFMLDEGGYARSQGSPLSRIEAMAREIADDDLHAKGRETEFHITVKFGLHCDTPDPVVAAVRGFGPVGVAFGETSVFVVDSEDPFEVVKVEVFGEELHKLNALIAENVEHTDTHPTYKPHVTLAYVKPGCGAKYAGRDVVNALRMTFNTLVFSSKERLYTPIPLGVADDGGDKTTT